MDEAALRLAARRVLSRMKRRADQDASDLSWFETETGMELEESWERVKEADKDDDQDAMATRLQFLVNKSNALRKEVEEARSLRGQSSRRRKEVHVDKGEGGPVRTKDKDTGPRGLEKTQKSPWQEHVPQERPEPKTRQQPRKPKHDTVPSPA